MRLRPGLLFTLVLSPTLLFTVLTTAEAQQPVKIGASLSLSGVYAPLGQNMQRGYQLCVRHASERGGLLGRKLHLLVYDDRSDPTTAVRLYRQLIGEDRVNLVLGPYGSPITEAVADVTERHKMPMMTSAAATSIFKKGRKFIFMIKSPAEAYLEGLIDVAAKRGLKTVAVVYENTLFAKAVAQGTVELAKKKGLQAVLLEAYPKGTADFSAVLTKIRAANPDLLAAATYFDDSVAIIRQTKARNVSPKVAGFTVGPGLPRFYELLGRDAEYIYGTSEWEPQLPYPGSQEFVDAHTQAFPRADLSYHTAGGYAACQILVQAVKHAGSLDGEKVRDAILELGSPNPLSATYSVYGLFKVNQEGLQIAHKMVLFQWQEGKKVILWPEEVATGKPRFPTPPWSER